MRSIPATSTTLVPWVIDILRTGPKSRSELWEEVQQAARGKGFEVADVLVLKKALLILKKEDRVTNFQHGWWQLTSDSDVSPATIAIKNPEPIKSGTMSIPVLREIGSGSQCVYVFQYVEDKARSAKAWPCKVGRSKNIAGRAYNESRTFQHQKPEFGLIIRCDDAVVLERAFHDVLHRAGNKIRDEWFTTSPAKLEQFYLVWLSLPKLLAND